jgi:hypothetical protein
LSATRRRGLTCSALEDDAHAAAADLAQDAVAAERSRRLLGAFIRHGPELAQLGGELQILSELAEPPATAVARAQMPLGRAARRLVEAARRVAVEDVDLQVRVELGHRAFSP